MAAGDHEEHATLLAGYFLHAKHQVSLRFVLRLNIYRYFCICKTQRDIELENLK